MGPFLKKVIKVLQNIQMAMKCLELFFNIKGPTSLLELRHDTNILSLEERRKEIWKILFFKSYAHCIYHNFHVPLKPEEEILCRTRWGALYTLLLN